MKKSLVFSTLSLLACASMSAHAWWGPYGAPYPYYPYANPYWGAPPYAQPHPAYAPPPWAGYAPPPAWGYQNYYAQPQNYPYAGQWDQDGDMPGYDEPADMQQAMQDAAKERKKAMEAAENRRATFRARTETQQAAVKAKRDAWRQQREHYAYPDVMMQPPQYGQTDLPKSANEPTEPSMTAKELPPEKSGKVAD